MTYPMAQGAPVPVWPLPNTAPHMPRPSRQFGANRPSGSAHPTRHHVGLDLTAKLGDPVVATEDGTIVATQRFNGPRAHAILVETDTGIVVLYGEVAPGSWTKLGLKKGDRVQAGQQIAEVGINPGGSQMLHLETYVGGTRANKKWRRGTNPPGILDPTAYVRRSVVNDDDPVKPIDPIKPIDPTFPIDPDVKVDQNDIEPMLPTKKASIFPLIVVFGLMAMGGDRQ